MVEFGQRFRSRTDSFVLVWGWASWLFFLFNWSISALQRWVCFQCAAELFVIQIHTSILFQILFPYRLFQNIEQSSLCYIQQDFLAYPF